VLIFQAKATPQPSSNMDADSDAPPPPIQRRPSWALRDRRPSISAPLSDLKGPVGPDFTRPKHKRTSTGFGPAEIKAVQSAIPEPQRAAYALP